MFLSNEGFYPTKILTVPHQHDLAAHINLQILQLLEVLRRPIIRINDFAFYVTGRRHAIEGHNHSRIVLIRIAIHMLACGPVHCDTHRRRHIHADLARIIHPNFVFNDFSFEARFAEFLRHILGGGLIFRRARHMRRLR